MDASDARRLESHFDGRTTWFIGANPLVAFGRRPKINRGIALAVAADDQLDARVSLNTCTGARDRALDLPVALHKDAERATTDLLVAQPDAPQDLFSDVEAPTVEPRDCDFRRSVRSTRMGPLCSKR